MNWIGKKQLLTWGILGVLFYLGGQAAFHYGTEDEVLVTITDKERVANEDGSYYLLFSEQETFRNTDSLWFWKFRSSDLQGQLQRGRQYRLRVYGWRLPWLSRYRNVVEATPENNKKKRKLNETTVDEPGVYVRSTLDTGY